MKKDAIGQVAVATGTVDVTDPDGDPDTDDFVSADAPLSIVDGDFMIAVGDADAVELTGDYESVQDLVDAINSKVAGASAWIDADNHVVIASSEDLTTSRWRTMQPRCWPALPTRRLLPTRTS